MTTDLRRQRGATIAGAWETQAPLDYYLILPPGSDVPPPGLDVLAPGPDRESPTRVEAIVIEEFLIADDHVALGLHTAVWTSADQRWWSAAGFARAMRADPQLRDRAVPAGRRSAETAYRGYGGGALPDEATLRENFGECLPLVGSAPLRLTPVRVPGDIDGRRVYRILFAKQLSPEGLARLRAAWGMADVEGIAVAGAGGVAGTAQLSLAGWVFGWDVRRIGGGVAWCLDVTVDPAGEPVPGRRDAVGPLLRELTATMRREGLIPVTIERFR